METYTCAENLNVRSINTMKDSLLEMLKKGDGVVIDFSALNRIDLSVAQVVIAAQKEAKKRHLQIRLSGLSAEVKNQLFLCGVVRPAAVQE